MDKPESNPTDHHLNKPGNFVSARSSPILSADANISGYCLKHDVEYSVRCPWCPTKSVMPPEIIEAFEKAKTEARECAMCNRQLPLVYGYYCEGCHRQMSRAADVLDLEPDWALTSMDIGGVHLERLIGGVRVSMILPDGDAVSEEFTGPEFYEVMYRCLNRQEKLAWETWLFLAAVTWVFVAGLAAFFTGV